MFFDGLPIFLTYSFLIRLEFERNVLIVNEYIWLRYVEEKKTVTITNISKRSKYIIRASAGLTLIEQVLDTMLIYTLLESNLSQKRDGYFNSLVNSG